VPFIKKLIANQITSGNISGTLTNISKIHKLNMLFNPTAKLTNIDINKA
jgi:hypothetical protein